MTPRDLCPGVFKLDHLQPTKMILPNKIPHFYLSYWEVQFLITPERGRKIRNKVKEYPIYFHSSHTGHLRLYAASIGDDNVNGMSRE